MKRGVLATVFLAVALTFGAPGAQAQDELPPGHPPVPEDPAAAGAALPKGHPPVEDAPEEEPAAKDPHAGAGAGAAKDPRIFMPPSDGAEGDEKLPPGTVVVSIRDAKENPLPKTKIALIVKHGSISKGDSEERFDRETDEKGEVRFDRLATDLESTYRLVSKRGQADFEMPPFRLNTPTGKRAVLHIYDSTSRIDDLMFGMQGYVVLSLREDVIQVEQVYQFLNVSPKAWTPDITFALPAGFKALTKPEDMGLFRIDEVSGTGAALRGTLGPGRHEVTFRYHVPLAGDERQALKLELMPRVFQLRVIAEASKTMALFVEGFPPSERVADRGRRVLVTEQRFQATSTINVLDITLTGLPTKGPGRWIAVGLGVTAIAVGLAFWRSGPTDTLDPDAEKDLLEAREALLGELVALEQMRKRGEIGPKTYVRVRGSLLDALARVMAKLETGKAQARKARELRRAGRFA